MDDDLNALRGGPPQDEDDFFSSLGGPPAAPSSAGSPLDLGLEGFDKPAPAPAAPEKKAKAQAKKKPKPKRRPGKFLGMSPQQRMVLSIFLFLDVAVLGCLILFAAGSIGLPGR